ncbi:hypothetical protein [Acetobacterium wieringae]|uniref:hypothetical protein n=1 Tax=Acetobacterium wieringae TaxID=52694 RepID=UPI0031593248
MSDLTIYLCTGLILAGISGASVFIKKTIGDLPDRIHQKNMEQIKHINSKELQIDNYFRQVSGKEIESLLNLWMRLIPNNTNSSGKLTDEETLKRMNETIMYGSEETIRRLAILQQYIYKDLASCDDNGDQKRICAFGGYFLIAYTICQLKKDFTGYDINPEDIMRITVTDYEDTSNKNIFDKAHGIAKEKLGI